MKTHHYSSHFSWTGNLGQGTNQYDAYKRDFDINVEGKVCIKGSSDPKFLGDPKRHNPEDLFLASISSCHALWYLHLCAQHKIVVQSYEDFALGEMEETANGSGRFTKIILQPKVQIQDMSKEKLAIDLHEKANQKCFIANSLNIKVDHKAEVKLYE